MNPTDQYQAVNTLQIGDILSNDFISNHELVSAGSTDDGKLVYTAPSSSTSQPHIIHTDANQRVLFIQITLPVTEQVTFTTQAKELGIPEITTSRSSAEILWAFPTKGVSYIFNNYAQSVKKVQKYSPQFTDAYMETIGSNYTPQESMPPITIKDRVIDTYQQKPVLVYGLVSLLAIILVTIVILKKRRHI